MSDEVKEFGQKLEEFVRACEACPDTKGGIGLAGVDYEGSPEKVGQHISENMQRYEQTMLHQVRSAGVRCNEELFFRVFNESARGIWNFYLTSWLWKELYNKSCNSTPQRFKLRVKQYKSMKQQAS